MCTSAVADVIIQVRARRHPARVHFEDAPSLPVAEILPAGIIYALVFLIGTGGNLLVVFVVVHFKNMRTVTNMFLASLSTADLCLIWFCVPIQVWHRAQSPTCAHKHST